MFKLVDEKLLTILRPQFFWFDLLLYVPVNSYGHVRTVSLPNHTFFLGKLEQVIKKYFLHILSLVTDNPS